MGGLLFVIWRCNGRFILDTKRAKDAIRCEAGLDMRALLSRGYQPRPRGLQFHNEEGLPAIEEDQGRSRFGLKKREERRFSIPLGGKCGDEEV
jgi:hypothetical protein